MSRGIRSNTLDRVMLARDRNPTALGPLMGELATRLNIPSTILATLINTHDQTVTRWMTGQSTIGVGWLPNVAKTLALLTWMHDEDHAPLTGTRAERVAAVAAAMQAFKAAAKLPIRSSRRAA